MVHTDLDEKIARVSDILEQIEDLNQLLDFQQSNGADASTIRQYEFMRDTFVQELRSLLKSFRLELVEPGVAA
ncbi:MAG: hypothetical protein KAX50_11310 [Saprospiraceae bacterium]|nr:hypothetical protein [Saprospiraceae bacterium]